MSKYTLVLYRQIVAVSLADAFVCGGVNGQFQYEAWIKAEQLDNRGFILDVKDVIGRIEHAFSQTMLKASCEELCNGVAHTILSLGVEEGIRLTEVKVRVKNMTGHVELLWEDGDTSPAFPRAATAKEREEKYTRPAPRQSRAC